MSARSLVVGHGSIGVRHARVLAGLGCSVEIVSRRASHSDTPRRYVSLTDALASGAFDHIVIANETSLHGETLAEVAAGGHCGTLLVEKPLTASSAALPGHRFAHAGVGYNLRFHPAVQALRGVLRDTPVAMARLQVGQWLADWRPSRETVTTYSASRADGGGALRDLSHELDLALWLFGPWRRVAALGGRHGDVTLDADDSWGILLECERCPLVTIALDCLDRKGRRALTVQAGRATHHADLVAHTIEHDRQVIAFTLAPDQTYAELHKALHAGGGDVCTLHEGMAVVRLIDAIERAAATRRWIANGAS